jgi:hypothetical protein
MMICERCGWLVPDDCACRRNADQLSIARARAAAEDKHRESVARAYRSGWPARHAGRASQRPAAG